MLTPTFCKETMRVIKIKNNFNFFVNRVKKTTCMYKLSEKPYMGDFVL